MYIEAGAAAQNIQLQATAEGVGSVLAADQIIAIDAVLVSACSGSWRKVARVVGMAMNENVADLADIYYAQRVDQLVLDSKLVVRGDQQRMRFSEVRLP